MEALLRKIYYDEETGFSSASLLYKRAKAINPKITRSEVDDWLGKQRIAQLYQKRRTVPQVGFITAAHINYGWQADLVDMRAQPGLLLRKRINWLLVVVDVFSRKLYVRPLSTKESEPVGEAFVSITDEAKGWPLYLTTDQGTEFGRPFAKETGDLNHTKAKVGDHRALGVVDSAIRIFKTLLYKFIESLDNKSTWPKALPKLVLNYNNTPRTALLGATPNQVQENIVLQGYINNLNQGKEAITDPDKKPAFQVGDKVAVPAQTGKFKRGFKTQFTSKKYPIVAVNKQSVVVDVDGQERRYLFSEILRTGVQLDKDVYEVEKILDNERTIKRGRKNVKQKLVKFKGESEPEWVDVSDIITS